MPTEILGGFRSDESRAAGEECGGRSPLRRAGRALRRSMRASQQPPYQQQYGQQPYGQPYNQQQYDPGYAEDGSQDAYV